MADPSFPSGVIASQKLDLNRLVANQSSTYFVRMRTNALRALGISSGDILIVDRSLTACSGDVVVGRLDGTFVVREYTTLPLPNDEEIVILAGGPFANISLEVLAPSHSESESRGFDVWGVVTYSIQSHR